jgi:hypothetical protein
MASAGALLQEPFEAPAEDMLLEATGGETRATRVVARRIGALLPELHAAVAAEGRYPPMGIGILDPAALGPTTGITKRLCERPLLLLLLLLLLLVEDMVYMVVVVVFGLENCRKVY